MSALTQAAVRAYAALGWSLLALPFGEKKTTEVGWPDAPDDPLALETAAQSPMNLGVRLGPRSGYLADVDLDDGGAVALAPYLLPPTGTISGHAARPRSHYFYVCPDGPEGKATRRYADPSGGATPGPPHTYTELRWHGAYTVLPPSLHPNGSPYEWEGRAADDPLPPTPVAWDTLNRSVREVAAGALLLAVYPEWTQLRSRHYATLALAGVLLGAGWDQARTERFVFALARAAGDEEADDRVDNVRSTADRLARGEPMSGWPALVSFAGSARVDRLKRFLGINGGGDVWSRVMSGQTGQGGGAGATPPAPQPQQAPAAPTRPAQAPSVPQPAPVIATAQQAAQQASAQVKAGARYSKNKVALDVALNLQGRYHLARDEGRKLYRYQAGVYRDDDTEMRLRAEIAEVVLANYSEDYLDEGLEDEVLHRLTVDARLLEERPERGWINVANGRLNLLTGDLEPHHPRHCTTIKLPVVYDKTATCPNIERFCAQIFEADAMAEGVPWQVFAMCAVPARIDKAILLLGPGSNGKGVFLDIVHALIGRENTSSVSLQAMGKDPYGTADLRGKLLNLCADLPTQRLEDSGEFKMVVSGERIRAQRKFGHAFDFHPFCRLLFSANNLPESGDTSPGYRRRWYMIPFGVSFEPGSPAWRPREEILTETTSEQELSGLLNKLLPHARRFVRGDQPTSSQSMDEAIEEFAAVIDPFPGWLASNVIAKPGGWLETAKIIERYYERVNRRGREYRISPQAVGLAIREQFPAAVRARKRIGGTGYVQQALGVGKQRWGWDGLSWTLPSALSASIP